MSSSWIRDSRSCSSSARSAVADRRTVTATNTAEITTTAAIAAHSIPVTGTPSQIFSMVMRIALGSDERTVLTDAVVDDLRARGAEVVLIGPPAGENLEWAEVGRRVGEQVAAGTVDMAVVFCWTGTGASMAANKVRGVRAALCTDAETAAGARRWNDANVLVMSLRLATPQVAKEMLDAWFATDVDPAEAANISALEQSGD
jgi:ribose 5-phosphate isomerase B